MAREIRLVLQVGTSEVRTQPAVQNTLVLCGGAQSSVSAGLQEMKQIKSEVLEIARCARNIAGAAEDVPVDIAILLDENKGV
ncbi:MAG: hypothetical protein ACI351_01700 [Candidatus Avelusimicrobium sp.]|uniref:hypothetical protein n=1 Tax=Candidatus Avelusimicrobium sp. TaxID=3048833 RepID=UPI003F007904